MTRSAALGIARLALGKAVDYANNRAVWGQPIGARHAQHAHGRTYPQVAAGGSAGSGSALCFCS
jgi:alkylation response protein AidB-like acyl-CoA dehydrogenase